MLIATNISVAFDELPLMKPQSFVLNPGECLHMTGENGSGKTSLLKGMIGINDCFSGKLCLSGAPLITSDIGYIGHQLALFYELTVSENLEFWSSLHLTKSSIKQALDKVGLLGDESTLVSSLSQGQKKRLALARFFYLDKNIWLLDEPFNALDKNYVMAFAVELQLFLQTKGYLVITSHQSLPLNNIPIKVLHL